MASFLKIFLPIFGITAFMLLIVFKVWLNWKKYGENPLIISKADDAHSLIGRFLVMSLLIIGVAIGVYSFAPAWYPLLLPATYLEFEILQKIGVGMLVFALFMVMLAQHQMHSSWRIGIDHEAKTDLITSGIFQYSRNPIYVGAFMMMVGLFLIIPNALTLLSLMLCFVLMQVQVRLEEAFLVNLHGDDFKVYCKQVRRWI